MITLLMIAVASYLVLGMLFLGYPTVYRLKDRRDEIDWWVKLPVYLALILGLTADVVFNATWGSLIFRELPKEWVFTDRLQRHWCGKSAKQKARAEPWVRRVNLIDPGHVKNC